MASWGHKLTTLKKICNRFGAVSGGKFLADQALTRLCSVQGVEFVFLHKDSLPAEIELPSGFQARFLSPEELLPFTQDPSNNLELEMVERLRQGKDFCYAALHDNRLAAYGWYSLRDIEAEHNFGISMKFPENYAYMYKGFTHTDFRGKRLHGILMGRALQELGAKGVEALVSSVSWTNFASLISCDKLGYERLGRVWSTRKGKLLWPIPSSISKKNVVLGCEVASHLLPDHSDSEAE